MNNLQISELISCLCFVGCMILGFCFSNTGKYRDNPRNFWYNFALVSEGMAICHLVRIFFV